MPHIQDLPTKYTMSRRDHERRKENVIAEITLIEHCKNSNYSDSITYTQSLNSDPASVHGYFVLWDKVLNKKFIQENIKKLDSIIINEFKHSHNLNPIFLEVAKKVKNDIAQLNFTDVIIEYLSNNSIQFTLSFPEKKLLMIDKFIYPEENGFNEEQIIYSYFINRKLISSNVVEISDFVKKFQEYIAM